MINGCINVYEILLIVIIYISLCIKANEYNPMKELVLINMKKSKEKIIFLPFIGCGFANKMPTLTSSFLLSILSYNSLVIVKWNNLLHYFQIPKQLFKTNFQMNHTKVFNRNNYSVLGEMKKGYSLCIYTYHSFTSSILNIYNISNKLKQYLIKQKQEYKNLDSLLQKVFLKPKDVIMKYIVKFKSITSMHNVIGIHIRTGYLSDFGEKDNRFFNNKSLSLYINTIDKEIEIFNQTNLYIISDSSFIKEMIINKYRNHVINYSIPGAICHARFSMHNSKEINQCVVKLIAENYILSECKLIIGSNKSTYFNMACNRKKIRCISVK